ncbi:MAG: hypothetical protein ACRDA4_00160 [Filifactoraceae bacterium]
MHNKIEVVINNYIFKDEGISISRSYSHEPPMDYISVWIRIFDEEDSYICEYTAFYDYELNFFDDKVNM